MADFAYTIKASPGGHPEYSSINGAVADFAANNRCGAGTNTVGATDTLSFRIQGFHDFGGTGQAISGITVNSGGRVLLEAHSNPFNAAATTPLKYVETFDGLKHNATERLLVNQANLHIRNLVIASGLGGGYGAVQATATSGARGLIESCLIYNSGTGWYVVTANATDVDVRNCVCLTNCDNSSGALRSVVAQTSMTLEQCTIVNLATAAASAYGVYQNAGSEITAKNCYVGGFTAFGLAASWAAGCVGNSTDGTDTPENNTALESIALSTTNFENVTAGSEDLRVKSASALMTTGATRLGAVLTDIFGASRNATTTVGAHAAEAGGGGSSNGAAAYYYAQQ